MYKIDYTINGFSSLTVIGMNSVSLGSAPHLRQLTKLAKYYDRSKKALNSGFWARQLMDRGKSWKLVEPPTLTISEHVMIPHWPS
jgi:hypothetical protein